MLVVLAKSHCYITCYTQLSEIICKWRNFLLIHYNWQYRNYPKYADRHVRTVQTQICGIWSGLHCLAFIQQFLDTSTDTKYINP